MTGCPRCANESFSLLMSLNCLFRSGDDLRVNRLRLNRSRYFALTLDLDRRGVDVVRLHDLGGQVALKPSYLAAQLAFRLLEPTGLVLPAHSLSIDESQELVDPGRMLCALGVATHGTWGTATQPQIP